MTLPSQRCISTDYIRYTYPWSVPLLSLILGKYLYSSPKETDRCYRGSFIINIREGLAPYPSTNHQTLPTSSSIPKNQTNRESNCPWYHSLHLSNQPTTSFAQTPSPTLNNKHSPSLAINQSITLPPPLPSYRNCNIEFTSLPSQSPLNRLDYKPPYQTTPLHVPGTANHDLTPPLYITRVPHPPTLNPAN